MIQERRGLLKVWNVFLVSLTFLMTIFGTFLTRSGAIASVHSFAQSSIGTYFVWFIGFAAAVTATLIFYRWPELRDLPASPRLRKSAVLAGWIGLIGGGPAAAFVASHLPMPIVAFALLEGLVAWVAMELVYRRMTASLKLRSTTPAIESILSREFTFLLNNYALLGFMLFVCVATTFPMISEAFWNEKVTVGPPYYNAWVQPIGLVIFALMGIGTLLGWKKTSPQLLRKAFFWLPSFHAGAAVVLLALVGKKIGFAAVVWGEPIYAGALGQGLRAFNAITPALGIALVGFNVAVILQEFTMLFRSRAKSGADKGVPSVLWYAGLVPGFLYTMITLPPPSRRRYGGYMVVALGIVSAVPRLHREVVDGRHGGDALARPRADSDRPLQARVRERANGGRPHEANDLRRRARDRSLEREAAGRHISREVHLQEVAGLSDDGGGAASLDPRRPVPRRRLRESSDSRRELPGSREPARRLDLVRLHRPHLRQHHLYVAAA